MGDAVNGGERDSAGELRGWDDGRVYFYVDRNDPLWPMSGYCVSHDPELVRRLVWVCREHLSGLSLADLPPRPGPGDLTPWPPPPSG